MLHLGVHVHIFTLYDTDSQQPKSVATAAQELSRLLDPCSVLHSNDRPSSLLLLINFDEAHSLTEPIVDKSSKAELTRFLVLRRALRSLNFEPFFALFLSTAAKFRSFTPRVSRDSSQIYKAILIVYPPITSVGFDEFADRVSIDGSWTLTRLASTYHITHLGRAL